MDQIMVYGFCILAALILAAMLFRYRSMTKTWEKQMQDQKNSAQEMKEYHDILRIDMKCLLKDQEETVLHLEDSFSHMKETAESIYRRKSELAQEILCKEEGLLDVKNEISALKNETEGLSETTAEVLLQMEKLEGCSQSANDVYREFLEKNQERKKSADQVQKQADFIINFGKEFKEQVQWALDLAEQIELLSLNVNIEAAKNEEKENGFSVIALEMRKLSEESRELSDAFVRKNQMFCEYAQQNKDNIDHMIKLQETEQTKITKTGFLLEQLFQETQKAARAAGEVSGGIEGLETAREKILGLLEQLPSVKNHEQEETILEELQNILAKAKEGSGSLMKLTEEMQVRITE